MQLQPGKEVGEFVEFGFKRGSWETHGIPEHGCHIRKSALDKMLESGGQVEPDELIYGLMDWLDVTDDPTPALATLRSMLDRHYPADGRDHARCVFCDEFSNDRVIRIGAVDLSGNLVAWQRDNWVVALGRPSATEPGRLTVAAPGPLTRAVALRILSLGMKTFMDAAFESFAEAVAASGSTGNFYAWHNGEASTHHWPHGLGRKEEDGEVVDCSNELIPLPPMTAWMAPNQVAIMIGIAAGQVS